MMAREEYIRIFRSSVPGAVPSLTSGEIAVNLVDGKLFVGATNADGSLRNVVFNDVRASVTGIAVGHGMFASGTTGIITLFNMGVTSFNGQTGSVSYYPPIANSSGGTGLAYFRPGDFNVSATGAVTLDGNVVKGATGNTIVSGIAAGVSSVGGGNTVAINNLGVTGITAGYGLAALSSLTGTVAILPTGLTTTAPLDSFSVQGNDLYLSLGQHINLIRHSQDYVSGSANWNAYNLSTTPTSIGNDSTKGWPGGATGGISIIFAANANNGIYQSWPTNSLEVNTTYTVSCWARANSGTEKCRWSYYDDQFLTSYFSDDFNLTTTPQRVAFTFTTRSSNAVSNVAFGNGSGNATGTVLAWGFQLERGRFATDPIRTFGGTGASTPRILQVNSGVTGVIAGHGLSSSGNSGTITLFNMGVTSFNGQTGSVSYYPPFATQSVTGVASFNPKDFEVVTGVVSSRGVTGISAGNIGIAIDGPTGEVIISNMGVLSFNGSTGDISVSIGQTVTGDGGALVGANNSLITARLAETGKTGVASFSSTNFNVTTGAVSIKSGGVPNSALVNSSITIIPGTGLGGGGSPNLGSIVQLTNLGVTSFNGLTGAVTLTGDSGAVRGVGNNAITARLGTPCGTTGVVGVRCGGTIQVDGNGLIYMSSGNPCTDCQTNNTQGTCEGAGCYWCGCNNTCYCNSQANLCPFCFNSGEGFFDYTNSGLGVAITNGDMVNYIYLDVNNLSPYEGEFNSKTTPKVVMFDPDETGTLKTKAVSIQDLFVKNYNVFESKTPNQLSQPNKKGSNDKIEFEIVTGLLAENAQGLLKGGTAYEYIRNNAISAINGCTGGTFEITGTVQEVTVTTGINCRQIVIGLPDSVRIPHISGTGGTFSGTITANKFIGSMDGGLY